MRLLILIIVWGFFSIVSAQQVYNILAVRAEFQPDESELTSGDGKFDLSSSSAAFQLDPPPHNKRYFEDHIRAVNDYFSNVSTNKVSIAGNVFPREAGKAYLLPEKMAYYNPNLGDERTNEGLANLFKDALLQADSDTSIHFSNYNCIVVFHAGVGKDIAFNFDDTPEDIPSLYISPEFLEKYLGSREILLRNGAVSIDRGIVLPETESQSGIQLALNGIFASNMGSFIGLPDLFDVDNGVSAIGAFGLMDAGLFNFSGLLPSRPMAWTRDFAGWDSPVEILPGVKQNLLISSVENTSPSSYKIQYSTNESFWVEHRWNGNINHDSLLVENSSDRDTLMTAREYLTEFQPGSTIFDSVSGVMIHAENYDMGLPGSGILIWRIDNHIIDQNIDQNRINSSSKHRGISVVEADAAQDIGQQYDLLDGGYGSALGYQFDFWYADNPSPFYNNRFSKSTLPAAVSQYGNGATGVQLSDFSKIAELMSFDIENEYLAAGYPKKFKTNITPHFAGSYIILWGEDSLRFYQDGVLLNSQISPMHFSGSPSIQHNFGQTNYLAAFSKDKLYTAAFDEAFNFLYGDSIHLSGIKNIALGDGFLAVSRKDTLTQYQLQAGGLVKLNSDVNADMPYAVYLDDELFLFSSRVSPYTQNADSIFHPLYEESSQNWWVLTRSGVLLRFDRSLANNLLEMDLNLIPANQPILGYNSSSNLDIPAIYFISSGQMFAFDKNANIGENFPVFLNDFGKSDGSEIRIGTHLNSPIFLTRNLNGIIMAVKPGEGLLGNLSVKIDGPAPFWLANDRIEGFASNNTWLAFTNGINHGSWNGPGKGEISYRENLPESIYNPENTLVEKKSIYNWPNPNLDSFTYIRMRLNAPAKVNISIIDMAGDPAFNTSFEGNTGINEYKWNLSNIASGIYFARVEVSKGAKSESALIKIMVVK